MDGSYAVRQQLHILQNSAAAVGGAILNSYGILTVSSSTFSDNSADYGEVSIRQSGTLSFMNPSFMTNSAHLAAALPKTRSLNSRQQHLRGQCASLMGEESSMMVPVS